jgi:predicted transglutaminase-like cysteine proteinase
MPDQGPWGHSPAQSGTGAFPQWTGMVGRAAKEQQPDDWKKMLAETLALDPMRRVAAVNSALNKRPYTTQPDWETPAEFMARGGECRDYASAKYFALKAAGIPPDRMRIVVTPDIASGRDHAVLAIDNSDGTMSVLDNRTDQILSQDRARELWPNPYYWINESGYGTFPGAAKLYEQGKWTFKNGKWER